MTDAPTPTLYPFDLARALAGDPVVNKTGTERYAVHLNSLYPIVAINVTTQETSDYTRAGFYIANRPHDHRNLYMLTPPPPEQRPIDRDLIALDVVKNLLPVVTPLDPPLTLQQLRSAVIGAYVVADYMLEVRKIPPDPEPTNP